MPDTRQQLSSTEIRAIVDSDYANESTHRKSVTGIAIKIAGDYFFYKTNFHSTVALSSTEAEFIATYKAAKVILYIISIVDDFSICQYTATTHSTKSTKAH